MTAASSALARSPVRPADPHLVQIRDLVYAVAGIFTPDNKLSALEEGCVKRMAARGARTFQEYFECLTRKADRQTEMAALLNEITIGETCLFRNQPQLDALRNIVLPRIVEARANASRHVRIWSAGCSTGEEPYTISMVMLEETAERLKGWTFEILATDLNEEYLLRCHEGAYGENSTRNLTPHFRDKYFSWRADDMLVSSEVKAHVNFSRVNLLDDKATAEVKDIDIIFCCNVLIYFDVHSKQRVIQSFNASLLPHGYLLLGHAESLFGVTGAFHLVHLPNTTAYVKAEIS